MNTKHWNIWNKACHKCKAHTGMLQLLKCCFKVILDFASYPDYNTRKMTNTSQVSINEVVLSVIQYLCSPAYSHDQFVLLSFLSSLLAVGSPQSLGEATIALCASPSSLVSLLRSVSGSKHKKLSEALQYRWIFL